MLEWFQSLTLEAKVAITVSSLAAFGSFVICRVFAFGKPSREVIIWNRAKIQELRNHKADLDAMAEKRVLSESERVDLNETNIRLSVMTGKEVR